MFLPAERFGTIHDLASKVTWSAASLAVEAAARAQRFKAMGLAPGGIAAIVHGGTASFFADLFAVWSLGATAACLDPSLTENERANVIAFCKPVLVVGHDECKQMTAHAPRAGTLDDTALLLFTSGTTGAPKGVMLSYRAVLARLALNQSEIGAATLARTLVTLPTHFGHGLIGNALTPLTAGGDIYLAPRGLTLSQTLGATIDAHEISFMTSVPSLWQMALRMAPPSRGTLRRVHVGSAPLSATMWSRIAEWCGCPVVNCYGITETSNWIGGASSADHLPTDGLAGKPWGGQAAVIGADGVLHASGDGEIVVQTPSLMTGYFERPDLTAAALADGWYRTGDLGHVDAAGIIRLTGRAKDEINRGGFKVQPAEIDMLLESHSAVAEACTFGLADAASGEIVAVAVKLAPGATETAQTLRAWCLTKLRRDAVPERWFIVDDIPKTSRGKVSRDVVRKSLAP